MNDYCITVKVKRCHYYCTENMEKNLEKTAAQYNYHLVKDSKLADITCCSVFKNNYITFKSDLFSKISYEQLHNISQTLSESFKGESAVDISSYNSNCEPDETQEFWYFSNKYSAFDEPPFISEGDTVLKIAGCSYDCVSDDPFVLFIQNHGGVSKGLEIYFSGDFVGDDDVIFEEIALLFNNLSDKSDIIIPLQIQKTVNDYGKNKYLIDIPDFKIPEGISTKSAKLSGKKKQDECFLRMFGLRFIYRGDDDKINNLKIEIRPKEYPLNEAYWKNHYGI